MNTSDDKLCVETDGSDVGWTRIYESMLSEDEIYPVDSYREDFASGDCRIWETYQDGETTCFSIIDIVDDRTLLLAYLGTKENLRSRGIGSRHLERLLEVLKAEYPNLDAVFVDIEDARQPGIPDDDREHRLKRERFWRRTGGLFWNGSLFVPAMDGSDEEPTQSRLLWYQLGDEAVSSARLREVITKLYELYEVPSDNPVIRQSLNQVED